MKKEKLLKILADLKAEQKNLRAAVVDGESAEERASAQEALDAVIEKIADINEIIAELDAPAAAAAGEGEEAPAENERGLNVMATMEQRNGAPAVDTAAEEKRYNEAFMNFVCRGVAIPAELRGDATTTTTDASAVIPTTILNEIVTELKSYGNLYERVRKLNVQGGVAIPILSLKPTATWITADTATSESNKQKIEAKTSVTFNYYGLECKVSQTLLVNVTTLAMFQEQFAKLAVEAIAKALDYAIINGSGSGEPTGIVNDTRVTSGQKVTLSAADFVTWDGWKKNVFAKIKPSYRNGVFIMAQGTFDGYIDGMVDGNGQPIARVNYGMADGEVYRFGGKEVLIVENDIIKDYDSATGHASTGDVVAIFVNLNDYAINSNLEMKTVKWEDHDNNEIKNKVILIADGKLVDPNGVVIVKKGV